MLAPTLLALAPLYLSPRPVAPPVHARADAPLLSLTPDQLAAVGRRVWQAESGGRVAGLTHWNAGEDFASLGIGHFLWFPAGRAAPFTESFPSLLAFMAARGVHLPPGITPDTPCPWPDRKAFEAARETIEMRRLRAFLLATVDHQAAFLLRRLDRALAAEARELVAETRAPGGEIREHGDETREPGGVPHEPGGVPHVPGDVPHVPDSEPHLPGGEIRRARARRLASTPTGAAAMIDYINFKGEGTNPAERYAGRGWGLRQVLDAIDAAAFERDPVAAFAAAAARVLTRRVAASPGGRDRRWLRGWLKRVSRYTRPLAVSGASQGLDR